MLTTVFCELICVYWMIKSFSYLCLLRLHLGPSLHFPCCSSTFTRCVGNNRWKFPRAATNGSVHGSRNSSGLEGYVELRRTADWMLLCQWMSWHSRQSHTQGYKDATCTVRACVCCDLRYKGTVSSYRPSHLLCNNVAKSMRCQWHLFWTNLMRPVYDTSEFVPIGGSMETAVEENAFIILCCVIHVVIMVQ